MNLKKYIGLAALALPLLATAQTSIDFEDESGFASLGVYDSWEESPFMTGELEGNFGLIDNPLLETDSTNTSGRVLAFQRSRFGGNQYGVRIDLNEPIELSPTAQYVHVLIYKEQAGRVMLTGLGKRPERAGQQETEQFNALSTRTITTGAWCDAVFSITGAEGAEVNTLVVVPDCESTHDLSSDFVVYIDEIILSDSSTPRNSVGYYPINIEEGTTLSRSDRYTNTIGLTSPTDGEQTLTVNQQTSLLVYNDFMTESFKAKAGESVTPSVGYTGNWMHSYVYLDRGQDGKFSYELNSDNSIPDGSDVMSFSYYDGKNSLGTSLSTAGPSLSTPPSFTVPADLEPGYYRIRYKVDWDNVDPGGNTSSSNLITSNGGIIVDTRLNVHGDSVTIYRAAGEDGVGGLNGDVLKADGSAFISEKIPFGEAYTIMCEPAPGFKLSHVMLRHGYNLDGNSYIVGNKQYEEVTIPASAFDSVAKTYTIPAEYVDGNVRLIPYFSVSDGTDSGGDGGDSGDDNEDYYTINYEKTDTINRASYSNDRYTNAIGFTSSDGTQSISVDQQTTKLLYHDHMTESFTVKAGETVSADVDYTGAWMNAAVYIDRGQDGEFSYDVTDSYTPADGSDLMTFSYWQLDDTAGSGVNSLGESISGTDRNTMDMPDFVIPEDLANGFYRIRYKVDWGSIDPGGNTNSGNLITDNGGIIVDTRLNVHDDSVTLSAIADPDGWGGLDGKLYMADGQELGEVKIPFGKAYTIKCVPATGFKLSSLVLRHGHNLDGSKLLYGNQQYEDVTLTESDFTDNAYTIPAAYVDGDIRLTAYFTFEDNTFVLNEQRTISVTDSYTDAKLVLQRPFFKERWNSLILPVSLTRTQFDGAFGTGSLLAELADVEGDYLNFSIVQEGADGSLFKENTPYVVWPSGTGVTLSGDTIVAPLSIEGVDFTRPDATSYNVTDGTNSVVFYGSYTYPTVIPAYSYAFTTSGYILFTAQEHGDVKAYRCWLEETETDVSKVGRLIGRITDGSTTSIISLTTGKQLDNSDGIYDLQGRKVGVSNMDELPKGVYVSKGKKFVVH